MPPVKLSSAQINTSGSFGRARPVTISRSAAGRVSAPQINTRAAQIQYTPYEVPAILTDGVSNFLKASAEYSQVATQAAFEYKQRENKVFADHAILQYKDRMREVLTGKENPDGTFSRGFLNSEGLDATTSHSQFQDDVNNIYNDTLNNLDPRVRQMAMMAMSAERDTVLSRGAIHRSKQLQVADAQARDQRRKAAVLDIAFDPSVIYKPDKFTGVTGKEKFYMQFKDPREADKEWYNLISDVGEKIYLEQGFQQAQSFYQNVGQIELATSPGHATKMMSNIVKWENETIRADNSSRDLQLKQAKAAQEKEWADSRKRIEVGIARGFPPSKSDLADMLEAGIVDPKYARVVRQDLFGEVDALADPAKIRAYMDKLSATADRGFKYTNPDGTVEVVSQSYINDPELDPSSRSFLRTFEMKLQDPDRNKSFSRGKQEIATWMKPPWYDAGLYDREYDTMINQAENELMNMLSQGINYDDAIKTLRPKYDAAYVQLNTLPALSTGSRPKTVDELARQLTLVEQKYSTQGYASEDDYNADVRALRSYTAAIKQIMKIKPVDESRIQSNTNIVSPQEKVINTMAEDISATHSEVQPTEGN